MEIWFYCSGCCVDLFWLMLSPIILNATENQKPLKCFLPVSCYGLIVNSLPVLFSSFTVVQVISQDVVLLFGFMPLQQHCSVRVSDGHHSVRRRWRSWWESDQKPRSWMTIYCKIIYELNINCTLALIWVFVLIAVYLWPTVASQLVHTTPEREWRMGGNVTEMCRLGSVIKSVIETRQS